MMVKSLKCFPNPEQKKPQAWETIGILRGQDSPSKKGQKKNFYCLREEENPTFLATERQLQQDTWHFFFA